MRKILQMQIGFFARRGVTKRQCCTPLVLYTMEWGHLQYPFDELAAANARRRCGAVSKGQAHWLIHGAAPMLLPKHQMGSNTTQYHPIPPQYHLKITANTPQNDDPHAPPNTVACSQWTLMPPNAPQDLPPKTVACSQWTLMPPNATQDLPTPPRIPAAPSNISVGFVELAHVHPPAPPFGGALGGGHAINCFEGTSNKTRSAEWLHPRVLYKYLTAPRVATLVPPLPLPLARPPASPKVRGLPDPRTGGHATPELRETGPKNRRATEPKDRRAAFTR